MNTEAVLISINPKWCKLIMDWQKTVEIRKSRPKIDTPFKCYIYCTLSGSRELLKEYGVDNWYKGKWSDKKGKVIGEFVCDRISEYEMEWHGGYAKDTYQDIRGIYYDGDLEREASALVASNEMSEDELSNCCLLVNSRLSFDDIGKYVYGKKDFGFHTFYGWRISDLKIYDIPKELSEFSLTRPPQSWRYVEELEADDG